MVMVVLAGFVLNTLWSSAKDVLGYATNVSTYSLLQDTNIQRSQNGKSALSLNNQLSQAAQAKANDMVARDYWSHVTPDGKQPWQFIANTGYLYVSAGENLAYGFSTSSSTVAGWMNSPSHRANILNADYLEVGFGIANSANFQGTGEETVVVAMYAKPQKVVTPSTVQNGRAPEVPVAKNVEEAPTPQPTPEPTAPVQATPAAEEKPEASTKQDKTPTPIKQSVSTDAQPQTLTDQEIARVDILTNGNAQWAAIALSVLATVAAVNFIVRHGRLWRKYILKGENFVIKHPLLDIAIVGVGVLAFLLTRTSGFIQ